MAITPQDIEQLTFSPSKHGYDTEEVDNFLETLTGEIDSMLKKIADLKSRLTTTEDELSSARAQVAELEAGAASAPAPAQPDTSASERQISQVLIVAQQSADKIVAEARESADQIRNDADQKAREVIRQALAEKQQELDEIDRLKQSREDFRSEYKTLLQRFMDEAEAAFPNAVLSTPNGSASFTAPKAAEPPYKAATDANATIYAPVPDDDVSVDLDDLD